MTTANLFLPSAFATDVMPQLDRVAAAMAFLQLAAAGRISEIKTAEGSCFMVNGADDEIMTVLFGAPLAERDGLKIYGTGNVKA